MNNKPLNAVDAADAFLQVKMAADAALPPAKIEKAISRLPISADSKALIMKISQVAIRVGEHVVRLGRLIVSFALDLVKRFPNTAFVIIIGLVILSLVGQIAWVGPFLAGFLGPILLVAGVAWGAVKDLEQASMQKRIELLARIGEADRAGLLDRLALLEGQFRAAEAVVVEQGGARNEA
jgi:hypothetical protein